MASFLRAVFIVGLVAAGPSLSQDGRGFPVPRAQVEFEASIPFLKIVGSQIAGQSAEFARFAVPYGPFDLQIRAAKDHREASTLKNFYLGVAGAIAGVNPSPMANRFHCGPPCAQERKQRLVVQLSAIENLIADVKADPRLKIVSQLGGSDFRINNSFQLRGICYQFVPSPTMGFVPAGGWATSTASCDGNELGKSGDKLQALLSKLKTLGITGIVKNEDGSISAIGGGIGDNQFGVTWLSKNSRPPRNGEKLTSGIEFVAVEEVKPGVVFFETT